MSSKFINTPFFFPGPLVATNFKVEIEGDNFSKDKGSRESLLPGTKSPNGKGKALEIEPLKSLPLS